MRQRSEFSSAFHRGWLVTAFVLSMTGPVAADTHVSTLAPSDPDPEQQVIVKIRSRSFDPSTVTLRAGQKTKLVFQNYDVELHAFVPVGLFAGVNLNITGNGAPEFGHEGFKRVIIPSDGRAEIRFIPERPCVYPFSCDMPGHEMKATIVVQ
ncbi:MAG: cupredoxin domain-containing protein [Nitrospirota bacterium]